MGFRVCCLDIAQKQNICTLVVFLPIGSIGPLFRWKTNCNGFVMLGPMAISNIVVPISDTFGYFKSMYLCLDCLSMLVF